MRDSILDMPITRVFTLQVRGTLTDATEGFISEITSAGWWINEEWTECDISLWSFPLAMERLFEASKLYPNVKISELTPEYVSGNGLKIEKLSSCCNTIQAGKLF